MIVKDILQYLENVFPYDLACDFDKNKIGLTIGDVNNNVSGVLFALDLTKEVIEEAVNKNCNLIVSHHPFIFTPITKVLYRDEKGELIYKMIKNDISLIAMHTNMDLGLNGVADSLCELLKLKNSNILSFDKDELIRYGNIDEMSLLELVKYVKETFKLDGVKVVGDLSERINKIGIIGGSGGTEFYIDEAVKNGCQCFITGEIKHHIALYAKFKNICLIEVNHGIEKFVFNKLVNKIISEFNINALISEIDSNLFKFL